MLRSLSRLVCLLVFAALVCSATMARPRKPAAKQVSPVATLPEVWEFFPDTPLGPTLRYRIAQDSFLLSCRDSSFTLHVAGLRPSQVWPQPLLSAVFGRASRSGQPDLYFDEGAATFVLAFAVADSVLASLERADAFAIRYDDQTRAMPAPSAALRRAFVRQCTALVPFAVRAD